MNCEPNEEIPMIIDRKILTVMPKSFPVILSYEEYESLSEDEFNMYSEAGEKLKEKMLRMAIYL